MYAEYEEVATVALVAILVVAVGLTAAEVLGVISLIGNWPILLAAALFTVCAYMYGSQMVANSWYVSTKETVGSLVMFCSFAVGTVVLVFIVISGFMAVGGAVSRALERDVVPPSSVRIDPSLEKVTFQVACPDTPDKGTIQLFGKRTETAFRVKAYRMRAGDKSRDLTRPAWFSLSQREIFRSSPAPSFEFGPIRADGRWQSRRVQGTLSFSRGNYWLLDAGLGVTGSTGSIKDQRWLEERCDGVVVSF